MCNIKVSSKTSQQKPPKLWQRIWISIVVVAILVAFGSVTASAVWDGSGSAGGSGGTEDVTSDYIITHMGPGDAMGYRFTVYNGDGTKVGHCVDINFETDSSSLYRSYQNSKKSHIDLYREYINTGTAALGTLSTDDSKAAYVYYDTSMPVLAVPPTIGTWLTFEQAVYIASLCGAYSFGSISDHYMIVEPIYVAKMAGSWYAMTMAEYAVYQAHQIGWTRPTGSNHTNGTFMYNIGRFTSAVWGRYLYATGSYPVLGTSPVVESQHLAVDGANTNSILLPGNRSSRNTAENILKYQVGMAVYTDVVPVYTLDLNGVLDGASSTNINGFGTCDIYINNVRVANDVTDYCQYHTSGSTYEIKDIKAATGKTYNGVYSGSLSGTITESKSVKLKFDTNRVDIAYHPNGGTVGNANYASLNQYGFIQYNGTPWLHSIQHGNSDDPYNASTFGLTRPGYTFAGWKVNGTNTVLNQDTSYVSTVYSYDGDPSKTTANTSWVGCTLYAQWTPNKYTLTFDPNGGTLPNPGANLNNGTNTSAVPVTFGSTNYYHMAGDNPTKAGYTFNGWFTAPTGGAQVYSSNGVCVQGAYWNSSNQWIHTGDLTVYAQWTPITYTIDYNGNGSTAGSVDSQSAEQNSSVVILPNGFEREGFVFTDWNTNADGSGTSLSPGDSYSPTSNVTLYAQWEEYKPSAFSGQLRFILPQYLDTLDINSKWRQEPLKSYLEDILSEDLSDPDNCEQVWYFSADEYEKVHEWCLEHDKGEQTNKEFLEEFGDNRIK